MTATARHETSEGTSPTPIACTLDAGDFAERLAWIATLNQDGLRAHRATGLTLELTYAATVAHRVHELVRREQACCAFLTFDVQETEACVVVRITAPPETRDALDAVFAPFLPTHAGTAVQAADGCAGASCGCARPISASSADGHTDDDPRSRPTGGRAAGVAGTSAAFAALACGVCCVLPLALPAAALSALGGAIALAAHAQWWALGASAAVVAGGWLWVAWQSQRTRRRPARSTLVAMSDATLALGAAWAWSLAERYVVAALKA